MTDEEIIAVVTAHKEGKIIEGRAKCNTIWCTILSPVWNFDSTEYRIKPEPHYRPFESAEEVMEAIKEHGDWVKWKDGSAYNKIVVISKDFPMLWLGMEELPISYVKMFNEMIFADGAPFGKLVEE